MAARCRAGTARCRDRWHGNGCRWPKRVGDGRCFDGDLIGVHRTRDARSGQIVVARVDEEITVKLLKIGKDRIRLLPRNPDYAPIEVQPDQDFAIEGLYCGLVRPNR